ncbi:hypothetical protein [Streptomyces sp. AM6-12]|uniref:Orn/Lys/Arg family decarboxylase n=1 Tax=Streptomyces sp. AM6-12 TaxID=3345149 RepID=UPI00378A976C
MISPYPPGVPVVAPGEVITDEVVDYLRSGVEHGFLIADAADPSPGPCGSWPATDPPGRPGPVPPGGFRARPSGRAGLRASGSAPRVSYAGGRVLPCTGSRNRPPTNPPSAKGT